MSNPQDDSLLFQVPPELRADIFKALFSATRLTHGRRSTGRITSVQLRPQPHSLAILRSCRRIKDEIGDSWLSQVLFNFEDPETLLDKFCALGPGAIAKVRHVRTAASPLMIELPGDERGTFYRIVAVLMLLPGLQLDTLTVLGCTTAMATYDTVSGLIREGMGFKELYFHCYQSATLGYALDILGQGPQYIQTYIRHPQPSHWQQILEGRDGSTFKPSVVVYQATVADCPGAVMNPATRRQLVQTMGSGESHLSFGMMEVRELTKESEKGKELLIVVKRGRGASYVVKKDTPVLQRSNDIREDLAGAPWKEIRQKYIDVFGSSEEDEPFESDGSHDGYGDGANRTPTVVDEYKDVDSYGWTTLHRDPEDW